MRIDPGGCVLGIALIMLAPPGSVHAQTPAQPTSGYAVVTTSAPMYLLPDASRTPLVTLPAGATLRVIVKEGDWYRVEYRDNYLGVRTGYVLAANVQIRPGSAPPPQPDARGPMPGAPPGSQTPRPPAPPPPPSPYDRGFVSLNGMYQSDSTGFTAATTFTQNVEAAKVTTVYGGKHPIGGDFTVGYHVWRALDVAVGIGFIAQHSGAAVTAALPHPFFLNTPRTVSGNVSSLRRQEFAAHIDLAVVVPPKGAVQLALFGGPSVFHVKQGLVTAVTANELYPYDTATFGSATTVESSKAHVGYNGGVDVSVRLWKNGGIGGIVRYSRADIHLKPADGVEVKVKAGGLQAGAGVRFRF